MKIYSDYRAKTDNTHEQVAVACIEDRIAIQASDISLQVEDAGIGGSGRALTVILIKKGGKIVDIGRPARLQAIFLPGSGR